MYLKIHSVLPGSEFNLHSRLNLFPFPASLNKLFRRAVNIQIEASPVLTLPEVHELHLFDQGWLPNILPPSTHHLHLVKSPKINFAQGEFFFSHDDWQDFSARLEPEKTIEKTMEESIVCWAKSLRKMQGDGHTLWHYCADCRHWMFFCKADEGHCEFVMWVCRDSGK